MKYAANRFAPTFQALDYNRFPPSVANLPAALTINGITVLPTFRYKGGDAEASIWKPWGYGEILDIQILGDVDLPSLNQGAPMLGSFDDSVKSNSGAFYAFNNPLINVGTKDFVLELVIANFRPGATNMVFTSYAAPDTKYLDMYFSSGGTLTADTFGTAGASPASGVIAAYTWNHILYFYDKSGSAQYYVNGVASGSPTSVSSVGSLDLVRAPGFFARLDGSAPGSSSLAYAAFWQGASWLDTHLQATVSANRYAQLTKSKPNFSYSGVAALAVKGSATATYTQRFEGGINKLYYMGSTTPRWAEIIDGNGKQFRGMLNEVAGTNLCLQSQTFGSWAAVTNCSVPATVVTCPNGLSFTTVNVIEASDIGQHHFVNTTNAIAVSATTYVASVFAKAAGRNVFRLYTGNASRDAYVHFNVSTGVVGTNSANVLSSGMVAIGNGWYRCYVAITLTTTQAACVTLSLSQDNETLAYDGDGISGINFFGAQFELGNYPSSYIPTVAAPVTRTVDSNYYTLGAGDATPSQGTIYFEFWSPTLTPDSGRYLLALTDTTNNNHISLYLESGTGKLGVTSYSTGGSSQVASILTSTNKCDNLVHKVIFYWSLTSCTLMVDGVVVGTDATFDAPTALSRLNIGAAWNASLQSGPAIIGNIQIYPVPTTRIVYSSAADVNNAATYLIEA